MTPKDLRDIDLADAMLEPLEDKPGVEAPMPGKAKFTAKTRRSGDRRQGSERREEIRFQDDRRAGKDRRPKKGWDKGKNL